MARGKYTVKYFCTTAACVSMKPASKWHLNITRTRFTSASGDGSPETPKRAKAERGPLSHALPVAVAMNVRNSRRRIQPQSRRILRQRQYREPHAVRPT